MSAKDDEEELCKTDMWFQFDPIVVFIFFPLKLGIIKYFEKTKQKLGDNDCFRAIRFRRNEKKVVFLIFVKRNIQMTSRKMKSFFYFCHKQYI